VCVYIYIKLQNLFISECPYSSKNKKSKKVGKNSKKVRKA